MTTNNDTWNGHPNRETYMFHLHRANDEFMYKIAQQKTRAVLANVNDAHPSYVGELVVAAIRDFVEENAESDLVQDRRLALGAMRDIGSWWRIDEYHVGAAMIAEIAEVDAYA